MSWFRRKEGGEGKEAENGDVKPRNQIVQTPETYDTNAKKRLEPEDKKPDDQKQSFDDRIKVNQSDLNQQPEKKKQDTSTSESEDPNKGQRERDHPQKIKDDDEER